MTPQIASHDALAVPDRRELRRFIADSGWRFARTMPEAPDQYALRRHAASNAALAASVTSIREHGYQRAWGRHTYTYLDVDGRPYWTMGAPLDQTILINRAHITANIDVNVRFPDDPDPARNQPPATTG